MARQINTVRVVDRIEQLGLAAEQTPESPDVWLELANALIELGAGHPARHVLTRARSVAGDDAKVWLRIGEAYERCQDLDNATDAYRAAAAIGPGLAGGEVRLGLMLLTNGEADAAEMEIRAGLRYAPDSQTLHSALARSLDAQKRYALALVHAERAALSPTETDPEDLLLLARLQAQAGRTEERLATITRLREMNPGDANITIEYGFAALALGERIRAQDAFEEARGKSVDDLTQLRRLGQGLRACGALRSALTVMQIVAHRQPQSGEAALELALTFEEMGKPADAIEQFARALSAENPPERARFYFGRALLRVGRFEEASTHLLTAAAAAPTDDEIRSALSEVLGVLDGRAPAPPSATQLDMDLAVFSIAELIEFLAHQNATGVLTLASNSEIARVVLIRGRLLRCAPRRAPPLIDLLDSIGVISGAALDEVPPEVRKDDVEALRYVLANGVSNHDALNQLLLELIVEGLVELLDLRDGRASFVHGAAPEMNLDVLVDPRIAILEAARRKDERAAGR